MPVIAPRPVGDGVSVYDSPAPEFRLYRAELGTGAVMLPGDGARLVLCTEGSVTLCAEGAAASRDGCGALKAGRGESCFLSAADGTVTASGPAVIFLAATGPN